MRFLRYASGQTWLGPTDRQTDTHTLIAALCTPSRGKVKIDQPNKIRVQESMHFNGVDCCKPVTSYIRYMKYVGVLLTYTAEPAGSPKTHIRRYATV